MSWLDALPSHEKRRLRRRMRSPEAYEKLRESVKGPEDLRQEMEQNEAVAELKFALETEPVVQEKLKQTIEKDLQEQGIEQLTEASTLSPDAMQALQEGRFAVSIESSDQTEQEQMVLQPEGNVSEKIPLKPSFSEKYTAIGLGKGSGGTADMVTVEIQIDNTICGYIDIPADMTDEDFLTSARHDPDIKQCLADREPAEWLYQSGALLNIKTK